MSTGRSNTAPWKATTDRFLLLDRWTTMVGDFGRPKTIWVTYIHPGMRARPHESRALSTNQISEIKDRSDHSDWRGRREEGEGEGGGGEDGRGEEGEDDGEDGEERLPAHTSLVLWR